MAYIGKLVPASGFSFGRGSVGMVHYLRGVIYWRSEADGKLDEATEVGTCAKDDPKARARLQAKVDDYVGRYASFAERMGIRFEVRAREKIARKRAKRRAQIEAAERVRKAGPELLAALKALLAPKGICPETVAAGRAAIDKAEGRNVPA